jgi:Protein of unknown function (DUF1236)
MKRQVSIALAAGLLLAGASVASAAGISKSPSTSGMSKQPSDSISLTNAQQHAAWQDLNAQASNQTLPSGFQAMTGSTVPASIKLNPVPSKAATDVPTLRPYDFAKVQGKLLIVNPSDKKIAEVITG